MHCPAVRRPGVITSLPFVATSQQSELVWSAHGERATQRVTYGASAQAVPKQCCRFTTLLKAEWWHHYRSGAALPRAGCGREPSALHHLPQGLVPPRCGHRVRVAAACRLQGRGGPGLSGGRRSHHSERRALAQPARAGDWHRPCRQPGRVPARHRAGWAGRLATRGGAACADRGARGGSRARAALCGRRRDRAAV